MLVTLGSILKSVLKLAFAAASTACEVLTDAGLPPPELAALAPMPKLCVLDGLFADWAFTPGLSAPIPTANAKSATHYRTIRLLVFIILSQTGIVR